METRQDISGWQIRYDAAQAEAWRQAGIWRNRTVAQDARDLAESDPDRVCLIEGETALTYGEALRRAEALAAGLWARGLRPGDVISYQIPNWHEAVSINLAAALLGLVINPIVSIYREHEVATILADCRAKAIVVPGQYRNFDYPAMMQRLAAKLPDLETVAVLRGAPAEGQLAFTDLAAGGDAPPWPKVAPESVKLLIYTSGTTGKPKGVLHSHETMARAFQKSFEHWSMAPGDRVLMASPIGHVTGYSYGLEMPFIQKTQTILMERWDAAEAVTLIDAHEVVMTVSATPFLAELVEAAERIGSRLPSFKVFACGGAAVPPGLIRRANALFEKGRACRAFGSSEAPMVTQGFVGPGEEDLAADTDGQIVDFEVKVVDDAGQEVPTGQEGETIVRGPALFCGYADPEQTAEAFTADGFFRMGDVGYRTAEDGIVITGRKKDLIIRGGENLSAKEIEDALHSHPAIREAAAVSMPHRRLGETVCAVIVPAATDLPEVADLAAFLKEKGLARQKCPEHLEIVTDFPRTASGKIRKDQLRKTIAEKVERGEIAMPG